MDYPATDALLLQVGCKLVASSTGGIYVTIFISAGAFVGENNGEFTTDRNGQIVIRGLVPGVTITAQEKKTVSGYVLDETPQNILIQRGDAQKLVFRNAPKGALTVRKLDSLTGQPLSGAEFRILTVSGNPVDDNEGRTSSNGIYTTDANGEIVIAKLQPGVYKVSESKAPEGYVLDTTAQDVFCQGKEMTFCTTLCSLHESVALLSLMLAISYPM